METEIDVLLDGMLSAIQNEAGKNWGKVQGTARQILENAKARLGLLTEFRLTNQITQAEFESRLEDEKLMLEAGLNTLAVLTKVAVQNAANAAFGVLLKAVEVALKAGV